MQVNEVGRGMQLDSVVAESIDKRCRDLPPEREDELSAIHFKEMQNSTAGIPHRLSLIHI